MKKLLVMSAISATIAISAATAAPVMQQKAAQGAAMQQQQQVEITDALLEKFLVAMNDVQQVSQKYGKQFQNAEDQQKKREIQQKAQKEMLAAVNGAGLSPDEYNAVIQRVQQDPELQKRLQEMTSE
ncbi:MAG: hypothetical protein CMF22_01240 [Idiomarinaceae bacterium]|uniref:DUF4168 domain-containing protein n=1 Tax=Pseudidiomarina sp. TaxID=2081707 RepID=UPI000C4E9A22|nr:hypothetical protein [Idiomarinaceae bacterium]|tara:strand:+ start:531 stop:911 length:381 start_codon:yes stop_codon:yes gene_type:complete